MTPLYQTLSGQGHCSTNQRIETTGLSGTVTLAVGDEIKVQLFTNDGVGDMIHGHRERNLQIQYV